MNFVGKHEIIQSSVRNTEEVSSMNEKERIIELVRQNVISMEEALQLLEAAANGNKEAKTVETPESQVVEVASTDPEATDIKQVIATDAVTLEDLQKQLTINRQRQREIEILAELDGWNDTLTEQKETLIEEAEELVERIEDLEEQLEDAPITENTDERFNVNLDIDFDAYKDKFKDIVRETFDEPIDFRKGGSFIKQITQFAVGIAKEAVDYSVKASEQFTGKGVRQTLNASFDAEEVHTIDVSTISGDIMCEVYDGTQIEVQGQGILLMNDSQSVIESEQWATVKDGRLIVHISRGERKMDFTLKVPRKQWQLIALESVNGSIRVQGLQAKEMQLETVNGHLVLQNVVAERLSMETVNGDLTVKDSPITVIDAETVNGNVRIAGTVGQVLINGMTSNVYLTKRDTGEANVKVEVHSGDIKVAVPVESQLEAKTSVMSGKTHQRLSELTRIDYLNKGSQRLSREGQSEQPMTRLKLSTLSGHIYLKDTE